MVNSAVTITMGAMGEKKRNVRECENEKKEVKGGGGTFPYAWNVTPPPDTDEYSPSAPHKREVGSIASGTN